MERVSVELVHLVCRARASSNLRSSIRCAPNAPRPGSSLGRLLTWSSMTRSRPMASERSARPIASDRSAQSLTSRQRRGPRARPLRTALMILMIMTIRLPPRGVIRRQHAHRHRPARHHLLEHHRLREHRRPLESTGSRTSFASQPPEPTETRTPSPTRTSSPTRTPSPRATDTPQPNVISTDPVSAICGNTLTIKGRGFGASRVAVDGKVTLAAREVSAYESWSDTEIRVVVSPNTPPAAEQRLEVTTRGGGDGLGIRVSC